MTTSNLRFYLSIAVLCLAIYQLPLVSHMSAPCPVTIPNGQLPPANPFPERHLHHGNGALWTALPVDGVIPATPELVNSDGSIEHKFMWWLDVEGQLSIEGRSLDGTGPPVRARIPGGYDGSGFQASGIIFPSEGCWEVTGRAGASELTFVVLVARVDDTYLASVNNTSQAAPSPPPVGDIKNSLELSGMPRTGQNEATLVLLGATGALVSAALAFLLYRKRISVRR